MGAYRTHILIGAVLTVVLAFVPVATAQEGTEPFSVKVDVHIVVDEGGNLMGENGVAGLEVAEAIGPIDIEELKASAVLTSANVVQINLTGELTFTEPVSGLDSLSIASHHTLFTRIMKFESELATVGKLKVPGLDFSLVGAAGIIAPVDAHANLELAGAIAPID
jgi:hypothetical protein